MEGGNGGEVPLHLMFRFRLAPTLPGYGSPWPSPREPIRLSRGASILPVHRIPLPDHIPARSPSSFLRNPLCAITLVLKRPIPKEIIRPALQPGPQPPGNSLAKSDPRPLPLY